MTAEITEEMIEAGARTLRTLFCADAFTGDVDYLRKVAVARIYLAMRSKAVGEDEVELVARAIYECIDPNSGDSIATTIHCTEHIPPHGSIAEQLEQVMETCRAAARAAISAMRRDMM